MNATQNTSKWQLLYTIKNALLLNEQLYDNACNTPFNNQLALTIVILAGVSHALGSIFILLINRASIYLLLLALLIDALSIIIGYYVWTLTIWKVGQWIKSIDPTFRSLLSPIGFAYAPQILKLSHFNSFTRKTNRISVSIMESFSGNCSDYSSLGYYYS